nr:hypothetical protein CFP56_22971 [Quercus suber]
MASRSEWLDTFLTYDFDKSYFDAMDADDTGDDTDDDDWWGSECDTEDEVEFDFVNPLVGEMFAYMQRHYDKQPMRDSILTGQGYMDELDSNPSKCFEMFRMTHPYLLHLMNELISHGYLKEGQGDVDATQAIAMLLYILGHNTQMRCVADTFQHSTKTVSCHFRRVLRALHSYVRHLIKPDPNVVCLPKHLRVNKYCPWFERNRQRYVITACCCLHNFMPINKRCDGLFNTWDNVEYEGNPIVPPGSGNSRASTNTANQRHVVEMSKASKRRMAHFRDDITDAMWADYVTYRN